MSSDTLLNLDGQTLLLDAAGRHWVKFVVRRVAATPERRHGLDYSLTLHVPPGGERLVGSDNAHPVAGGSGPGRRRSATRDHRHRLRTVRACEYVDAATLVGDFWAEVDAVQRERGVVP